MSLKKQRCAITCIIYGHVARNAVQGGSGKASKPLVGYIVKFLGKAFIDSFPAGLAYTSCGKDAANVLTILTRLEARRQTKSGELLDLHIFILRARKVFRR